MPNNSDEPRFSAAFSRGDSVVFADLISREEAARLIGVTPRAIRAWQASGDLPTVRVGKRLARVRISDLKALITVEEPGQ